MAKQKLVINVPFMGVQPCKIEISKFLLLIGEQASGKSTIAKLIYFFQTLPDVIYENTLLALGRNEDYEISKHLLWPIRDKFFEAFGSTLHLADFDIYFYYSENEQDYIRMYKGDDGKAYSRFSDALMSEIVRLQQRHLRTRRGMPGRADVRLRREMLSNTFNQLFNRQNTDYNYLVTSRGLLASYPSLIGSKVRYELEKMIEDEVKQQDFEKKRRTGNEKLIFSFIEWSEAIIDYFRVNGGSFQSVGNTLENPIALQALITINEKILKGRYDVDSYGELIRINENERVYVKDASSGQQEVLRVLQAIFLATGLRNRREFMVVEEPEAHLFPLAQRELMNAFAVFLNTIAEGKLIITTHSPYILACVNLLLLADYSIAQGVNTASLSIPELYHLEREHFSCYSLGHRDEYCKSIKDPETGLIDQNYLDTISEQLGDELSQMYDLLSQNV